MADFNFAGRDSCDLATSDRVGKPTSKQNQNNKLLGSELFSCRGALMRRPSPFVEGCFVEGRNAGGSWACRRHQPDGEGHDAVPEFVSVQ
jgi:hypothetical protein